MSRLEVAQRLPSLADLGDELGAHLIRHGVEGIGYPLHSLGVEEFRQHAERLAVSHEPPMAPVRLHNGINDGDGQQANKYQNVGHVPSCV